MSSQTDERILEALLKESLEKDIIDMLAECVGISHREAMDAYYRSELSAQIDIGVFGIQYLDAAYLVNDLLDNEGSLLKAYQKDSGA